jgi:diguanylate cyclase (GGDEF)-like protein
MRAPSEPDQAPCGQPGTIARLRTRLGTIRAKLWLACAALSGITALVGLFAVASIDRAGGQVVATFDQSLMSINFARAAAADFATIEALQARIGPASDEANEAGEARIGDLAASMRENLAVAAERALSSRARTAASRVEALLDAWLAAREGRDWTRLDALSQQAAEQIDLLVNFTAGDAFTHRQAALRDVEAARARNIGALVAALLLSAIVTMVLARRLIGPVAAASAAANRIAAGELDTPIPGAGNDELGTLLGAMAVMRDNIRATVEGEIAERRSAQERLIYLSRHDALTGLPNRAQFMERLDAAVAQLGRGIGCAVLMLDLDDFRALNESRGTEGGDAVLRAVAQRLAALVRETDTLARLGGDEFAIIQTGIERPEDAALLARRVLEQFAVPVAVGTQAVALGLSCGIAVAPADGTAANVLLHNADTALARAKQDGRGSHRFFEAALDARVRERRQLEIDLREALAEEAFALHYQPLVDLASGRVTGFESLIRWQHPTRGMVSPGIFIPLAEAMGLIGPIGEWAIHTAVRAATSWSASVRVAVNVSPMQFATPRLVEAVARALAESGLPAHRLELEVTESALLAESAQVRTMLHQLKELGVRIAMDDFGTGYSSLSYLRSFPFDKIKIDQSFVRNMAGDAGTVAIVRAIAGLGSELGMRITAEGVETPEQLALLSQVGCHDVQGYLFSKPVPAAEVPALIARIEQVRLAA